LARDLIKAKISKSSIVSYGYISSMAVHPEMIYRLVAMEYEGLTFITVRSRARGSPAPTGAGAGPVPALPMEEKDPCSSCTIDL